MDKIIEALLLQYGLPFAIGGLTVFFLSLFLGKVWANRILEGDKAKYKKEFEEIKNNYDRELEKYKDKLETTKTLYLRYSEYQFKLYNDLWGSLMGLRLTANNLWNEANATNLIPFVKQLRITTKSVEKNRLLIEEEHYEHLYSILNTFGEFKIGKSNLLELRAEDAESDRNWLDERIRGAVVRNGKLKDEFNKLLEKLAKEFRKQIAGH